MEAERQARYPSLPTPVRLAALDGVPVAFVAAGPSAMHCLVGAVDGRLFSWGRNEKGQLGHGEQWFYSPLFPPFQLVPSTKKKALTFPLLLLLLLPSPNNPPVQQQQIGDLRQRNVPCVVGGLLKGRKAVAAAGGKSHSLVAVEGGDAFAFGSNTQGQCGLGSIRLTSAAAASATAPAGEDLQLSPVRSAVAGISAVAAGSDFSAWLNGATGALYTAGCPQYGVLGHGTDNEYNARDSSVKLVYAPQPTPRMVAALATVKIRAVACGTAHMLGARGAFFFFFFFPTLFRPPSFPRLSCASASSSGRRSLCFQRALRPPDSDNKKKKINSTNLNSARRQGRCLHLGQRRLRPPRPHRPEGRALPQTGRGTHGTHPGRTGLALRGRDDELALCDGGGAADGVGQAQGLGREQCVEIFCFFPFLSLLLFRLFLISSSSAPLSLSLSQP